MTTTTKSPAKWWAMSNNMGWGNGPTPEEARSKAARGGKRSGFCKGADATECIVYELDPDLKVTHIDEMNGHALHRPADAKPNAMGRYEQDRHPYKTGEDGKFLPPLRYERKNGKAPWRRIEAQSRPLGEELQVA